MDRVRIPADLNEEDVFFSLGPIKLSIRQLVTVMGGLLLWYGGAEYLLKPVIGLNTVLGLIALIWLPLACMILAFVKVKGRPVDMWVGEKLSYRFGPGTYLLRDEEAAERGTVDTDLYHDDDVEDLLRHRHNR